MFAGEIVFTLILAGLQVAILRVTQYLLPALYFTTSSLFDRRSDVRGGAILFRLTLPFAAGMLVPLVISRHAWAVASFAGVVAWFLVVWPIAWAPSLMFPHSRKWPITALLLAFWIAYALLPIAGAATTEILQGVLEDGEEGWASEFAIALITGLPISFVVWTLSKIAQHRITFADDEPTEDDASGEDESAILDDDELTYELPWRERLDMAIPGNLIAVSTLLVLVLILFRVRRDGAR